MNAIFFLYSTATIYMWYMYVMYVCEAQGDTYMWAGWLMMAQDVTQSAIFNSILFYSIVNSSATIYMIYVCDVCMWSTGWYIYTYICTHRVIHLYVSWMINDGTGCHSECNRRLKCWSSGNPILPTLENTFTFRNWIFFILMLEKGNKPNFLAKNSL